ncbi:MAG: hypothetical protein ACK4UN_18080, partial [Limisphaerales bacterium]
VSEAEIALDNKIKSGASWFYWIAALTAINTALALSGKDWSFIIGLGITQVFDVLGAEMGAAGMAVAVGLDAIAIGLFVLFGFFARKGHAWAFITGMALYGLDSCLSLLAEDWVGFGFHGFALFCIFGGYKACRDLKDLRAGE